MSVYLLSEDCWLRDYRLIFAKAEFLQTSTCPGQLHDLTYKGKIISKGGKILFAPLFVFVSLLADNVYNFWGFKQL